MNLGTRRAALPIAVLVGAGLLFWAGLRSRSFVDCWWIIEWGRIFLNPDTAGSMLMYSGGSSPHPVPWVGSLLSYWAFEISGRNRFGPLLLQIAAWVVLFFSLRRLLAARAGIRAANWITAACLLTPALVQSTLFSRVDVLAIAVVCAGLCIAEARRDRPHLSVWNGPGSGYALCCVGPFVWPSASILGILCIWHLWHSALEIRRLHGASMSRAVWTVTALPSAALLLMLLPVLLRGGPDLWAFSAQAQPLSRIHVTLYNAILSSPLSFPLFAAAALAGLLRVNREFVLVTAVAVLFTARFGIYDWRIIYLMPYAALLLAGATATHGLLLRRATELTCGLLVVGFALHFAQRWWHPAARPERDLRIHLARLADSMPRQTRVIDFTWDFYPAAAQLDLRLIRPWGGQSSTEMDEWFVRQRAELVINSADDAPWIFSGAETWSAKLERSGYCRENGQLLAAPPAAVDAMSTEFDRLWDPALARYPDYGPYTLWRPCAPTVDAKIGM